MPSIGASTCFHPTWTFGTLLLDLIGTCLAPCPTNQLGPLLSSPIFFSKNSTTHCHGEGWPCIWVLVAIIPFQVNIWIHHLGRVWWSLFFHHPCILRCKRSFLLPYWYFLLYLLLLKYVIYFTFHLLSLPTVRSIHYKFKEKHHALIMLFSIYFQTIFFYLCRKLDHFLTTFLNYFFCIFYHVFNQKSNKPNIVRMHHFGNIPLLLVYICFCPSIWPNTCLTLSLKQINNFWSPLFKILNLVIIMSLSMHTNLVVHPCKDLIMYTNLPTTHV